MNIRTVSTAPTQSAMRFSSASAANTTSNGPTDSVEPGLDWGIRAQPMTMAAIGGFTTVGTGILGSLASAIHPVAGAVVGGAAGAAVGYNLLPSEAGQAEKIVASGITGMLGAVCGYAGANSNVATYAILGGVGAVGGYAGGWMIKTAQQNGMG